MSAIKIKTETFLIDGEPTEVVYSGFKMTSIIDPEIEVEIHSIGGRDNRDCSVYELRNASEQIYIHEYKDRICNAEMQAEAWGDESRGN